MRVNGVEVVGLSLPELKLNSRPRVFPILAQPDENISLGNKIVKPLHEILGDEVGPALLVVRILHDRPQHFIADGVHMLQYVFGDLKEHNIVFEGLFGQLVSAYPQNDKA